MARRSFLVLILPLAAGCAIVSGLSQITVGEDASMPPADASIDTGVDTGTDAPARDASDAGMDSQPTQEASTDSGKQIVHCGVNPCTLPKEDCCRTDGGNGYVYACSMPNACAGLEIPCDDPRDCPQGTTCCGHFANQIIYKIACESAAGCSIPNNATIICDPNDQTGCVNGGTCTLSTVTLPGYYICK